MFKKLVSLDEAKHSGDIPCKSPFFWVLLFKAPAPEQMGIQFWIAYTRLVGI